MIRTEKDRSSIDAVSGNDTSFVLVRKPRYVVTVSTCITHVVPLLDGSLSDFFSGRCESKNSYD